MYFCVNRKGKYLKFIMYSYNPTYALLIFIVVSMVLFLLFRPNGGLFWKIRSVYRVDDKIVIEDILKQLYHSEDKQIGINFLVNALGYRDSIIISGIDKMIDGNLVYFEGEYLKLTEEGHDYALKIVRVHRLWERYLAEKTGFDKSEWHGIAEQKEHETDDEEAGKLASSLGNPIFDPHGDPIPTISGKIAELDSIPLSGLKVGDIGKIINIDDNPEIIYKQILAENIHIGSQIKVLENNSTRVTFYSEGEEYRLAPIVAANIKVSIVNTPEEILEDNVIRLTGLKPDEKAIIEGISKESRGDSRRRLLDLGFVKGAEISIDLVNPFGEPTAYFVKGTTIALRDDQARKILIKKD